MAAGAPQPALAICIQSWQTEGGRKEARRRKEKGGRKERRHLETLTWQVGNKKKSKTKKVIENISKHAYLIEAPRPTFIPDWME
jgi:hypothetical protein